MLVLLGTKQIRTLSRNDPSSELAETFVLDFLDDTDTIIPILLVK
jgi:hypothetical protein